MIRLLSILATAAVLVALAWTGWWYAMALGTEKGLEHWFDKRAEKGWQAEHGEIELSGFPFRLVRNVPEIRLTDPEAGWAWSAPFLTVTSGPVTPTHFDVIWPSSQNFAVPGESVEVKANSLTSRLAARPETALSLVEARVEAAGLEVDARSGWTAGAKAIEARVGARTNDEGYDVRLRAERVELPRPLIGRIDPLGIAGREVERLVIEGAAVFTRPLDRELIEEGDIGLVQATIRNAALQWGQVRLEVSGAVRVDEDGYPVGKIDVTAQHWREIVQMAVRAGAIGSEMAKAIEGALGLVASLAGDRDRLDATLRLEDGEIWLGPISVGDAPRLAAPKGASGG